jgi:hypothetical protein
MEDHPIKTVRSPLMKIEPTPNLPLIKLQIWGLYFRE